MIQPPFPRARERVGAAIARLYPGLDEVQWRRGRQRVIASLHDRPAYRDVLRRHPARVPAGAAIASLGRPSHLVVVPAHGSWHESWAPGTRNLYFEAAQNARENYGSDRVTVFDVAPNEAPEAWQPRLIDFLIETDATHLLTHIENDPGFVDGTWHWDAVWSALVDRWDGVLLGVMFDSAFHWIQAKSRFLGRMSPRFVAVDICMPMDGVMVKGRPEVGPVNMPVSRQSLALVDQRLSGVEPTYDVSFIGALYPHRVDMLDAIRAAGANVVVNPHRPDTTRDFAESRANQPSWLDFMAGLASSRMTLNFSRSSAGPFEQLKTRVLEATLAGTLLLTDDTDRTRRFFVPELEYGFFATPEDLPQVVAGWLADPGRLREARAAGAARARELAHRNFLDGIDGGLRHRGLPQLGDG